MKIVIDIPDEIYDKCISDEYGVCNASEIVKNAIRNGQVLPKGHGRLYDEKVLHDYWGEKYDLPHIPCVVEADRENEE